MREPSTLDAVLYAKVLGSSGGGGVTAQSVVDATDDMTSGQAEQTRENLNAAPAETTVTVTGSTPTIALADDNTIYVCGELSSLVLTAAPETGIFEILFTSGATATNVTLPNNCILPDGFAFEADTIYDMSVRMYTMGGNTYGLAAVQGWPVPSA